MTSKTTTTRKKGITVRPSNGDKIKAAIKGTKAKPKKSTKRTERTEGEELLSYKGWSPERVNFDGAITGIYDISRDRPLEWLMQFIGRVVFAFHPNWMHSNNYSFSGFIKVVNSKHAEKLFKAQLQGFAFVSEVSGRQLVDDFNQQQKALIEIIPNNPYPFNKLSYKKRSIITDEQVNKVPIREIEWFTDELGHYVYVVSLNNFNGPVEIKELEQADFLYNTAQDYGYRFLPLKSAGQIIPDEKYVIINSDQETEGAEQGDPNKDYQNRIILAIDKYLGSINKSENDLLETLYLFLNQSEYSDTVFEYLACSEELLKVMLKPEVNKILAENMYIRNFKTLGEMLLRLVDFMRDLMSKQHLIAEIEKHQFLHYTIEYSPEELVKIEKAYNGMTEIELMRRQLWEDTGKVV